MQFRLPNSRPTPALDFSRGSAYFAVMKIDIYSDTVCPWCFIGKRRLERALRERPQEDLEISWRAFQLNPDMPDEGMDRLRYLEVKFGGAEGARRVYDQVRAAGAAEEIPFDFEAIGRTPNTIKSHRLIRFAAEERLQDATVEALFEAYFLRGENIGDVTVLAAAAEKAGLDRDMVSAYLESDAEADVVRAEDSHARHIGIQGVPTFILDNKYVLSGAHPPEVLFQLFDVAKQGEPVA